MFHEELNSFELNATEFCLVYCENRLDLFRARNATKFISGLLF